jgi:hypothetical protein
MTRVPSALVFFFVLFQGACSRSDGLDQFAPEAYTLVLADFLEESGLDRFCISPWVGFSRKLHSPEVLSALRSAGYIHLDPEMDEQALPALNEQILTFYPIREDSLGVRVSLGRWSLWKSSQGQLRFEENAWRFIMACGWRGCQVVERRGPEYVDGDGDPQHPGHQGVLAGGGYRCPVQDGAD